MINNETYEHISLINVVRKNAQILEKQSYSPNEMKLKFNLKRPTP